jgi:DNA-binding transcriptional LysR family regulator
MTSQYTISHGVPLDWDDLRTFLAIARHKTLTAAARNLGLTQPTMGRRLAVLEERVGAQLLVKLPGGYATTPLGDMIFANVERIESEVDATVRKISGSDVSVSGLVRLTANGLMAAEIVAPVLASLHRAHTDVRIDLITESRNLDLARREADLALRVGEFDSKNISADIVGNMAYGIYGTADWADKIRSGDAKIITLLDSQSYMPEARWIQNFFPNSETVFRSNNRVVLWKAALSGIGLVALPRYLADSSHNLVRYYQDSPKMYRELWLGVHRDMRKVPRLQLVIDYLANAFREQAQLLDPID